VAQTSTTPIVLLVRGDSLKALIGGEIDFQNTAGIFAKQFAPTGQVRVLAALARMISSEIAWMGEASKALNLKL